MESVLLKCDLNPLKTARPLFAILLLVYSLHIQAAGPVSPGAGSILQQVNPASTGTGLKVDEVGAAKLPSSAPFLLKSIKIVGNTQFDKQTLYALVTDAEGKSLTVTELNEVAARITDYYRSHGFYMAQAIIQNQAIQDGNVVIEIIEARYGKIDLKNNSTVDDDMLLETLSNIKSGQAIELNVLDRSLLLLSDIPGVVPNTSWKTGAAAGTSDLLVETDPSRFVTSYVSLDNYGSRYNGKTRLGGTVNFINPLHQGDLLSLYGLSAGSGMNYGYISYESILNGEGTRMGGSYSALKYILGDIYASFNEYGSARVTNFWIKHPMVRSQDVNFYGLLRYDHKQLSDHTDSINSKWDRHLDNLTIFLSGDSRGVFLTGGTTTWNIGLTLGDVVFDDAAAQQTDLTSLVTQGGFLKFNWSLARLQSLNPNNSLYFALSGQWSNVNLDASEKIFAGGPYTVRAYDIDVLSGDTGYLGIAEFRHELGQIWKGQWQALGFIDTQHVTINKNTWTAGSTATLSGAGVGLFWSGPNEWISKAYVAKPIGSIPQLVSNTASARSWVEIGKGF
jgi:hemolysin activation/secretion protein